MFQHLLCINRKYNFRNILFSLEGEEKNICEWFFYRGLSIITCLNLYFLTTFFLEGCFCDSYFSFVYFFKSVLNKKYIFSCTNTADESASSIIGIISFSKIRFTLLFNLFSTVLPQLCGFPSDGHPSKAVNPALINYVYANVRSWRQDLNFHFLGLLPLQASFPFLPPIPQLHKDLLLIQFAWSF